MRLPEEEEDWICGTAAGAMAKEGRVGQAGGRSAPVEGSVLTALAKMSRLRHSTVLRRSLPKLLPAKNISFIPFFPSSLPHTSIRNARIVVGKGWGGEVSCLAWYLHKYVERCPILRSSAWIGSLAAWSFLVFSSLSLAYSLFLLFCTYLFDLSSTFHVCLSARVFQIFGAIRDLQVKINHNLYRLEVAYLMVFFLFFCLPATNIVK